jgi:hypothetical protein
MPMIGHRKMTRPTPPKNEMIPRIRSGREKKRRVLEKPIVMVRPAKKSTSPSANMAGSNKKRHPRNRKTHPKKSKPVPILVLSLIILEVIGVALRCSRSNGYRSSGRLVVKDRAPCLLSLLLALLCRVSLLDDGCFCRAAMWRQGGGPDADERVGIARVRVQPVVYPGCYRKCLYVVGFGFASIYDRSFIFPYQ